ncbi:MAG: peptidylprolyl isomerase [Rhodobacteraceae bacterium]|nr:peptidylprolyl isomerase [Paracoccaceae bacterium]
MRNLTLSLKLARLSVIGLVCALVTAAPSAITAQALFSPAIKVNDEVITWFELQQRAQLLLVLQAPGDPESEARRTLIEDRLKRIALREAQITVPPEEVQLSIEDMAANVQLTADDFIAALDQNGVDYETLRDFMETNLGWNEYVTARFLARARPTDEEIDRALGQTDRGSVQVRLAEVVIPITAQNAAQVDVVAQQISQMRDYDEFSEAARRYSLAPTAADGGVTDWLPLNNLPPALRPSLLSLAPGSVTDPILLGNAVGLFQLRGIREVSGPTQSYSAIDYALVTLNPATARDSIDTVLHKAGRCDDLYGAVARNPGMSVTRESQTPGQVPRDIAVALQTLDPEETAVLPGAVQLQVAGEDGTLTQSQRVRGVMLCGRTAALNQDASREDVARALTGQRLAAFAQQFLEQRRADSVILDQ